MRVALTGRMSPNEPRQLPQSDATLPSLEAMSASTAVAALADEEREPLREARWDELPCTD